ncbi:archaeal flagellin N-terminal-like domain-containing protein [Bimuria novae-zelandiae CBS 107.79]|uniref:Archaeal flagellin N-terminal-like domain-containing protein n=1 Tax=Bimuria novae-zelandiae CBS 107.79 TaxID=1447943 RepID=A0A6A5UWS5_9PLEO|nr:archaeal flagellin N-terminal-like domain-containing protein [Bimuria novae-zelandiae CBS 107.79]
MASSVAPGAVIPLEATLLALAIVVASGRLVPRLVQRMSPTMSDSFLVASVLNTIALFVTDVMTYDLGGISDDEPSEVNLIKLKKVQFAGNYFYDTGIYLPKLAIVALYFRLFPPTMPWLRKALYVVTFCTGAAMVTTCFLDTFWCGREVSLNWSTQEGACNTFNSKEVFRTDWAMNVVTDVSIYVLPFPLLYKLQLGRRQKWGLLATFALGAITIAVSIVRFATIEVIHAWTNVFVLSMAEMSVAIIVVSLPSMRGFLRRGSFFSSKKHYGSCTGGYGPQTPIMTFGCSNKRARVTLEEDSGSEVELNALTRKDVIYETRRISEWILLIFAFVFVAARVYTRLIRLRENLNWADSLLIASALDALGLIICDTLTYQMGVLDEWEPSVKLSKISFASNYFYDFGMGFPKLSMLAFYWAYFDFNARPAMRNMLWALTAFVVACYLTILFDDTFFCGVPVSIQWSQEEDACSVFYAPEPFILNFTLNLACYLVVYAIPLILLSQGVLRSSKGIALTFVMGGLTIASSIVRFVTLKVGTGQENLVYPLSMLEMTLSIIVVALPGLKPLIGASHGSQVSSAETEHHTETPKSHVV